MGKRELQDEANERDRGIQNAWVRTLTQIPTKFGKLAYVAGLRDENSDTYHHVKLALRYTDEEADCFLRASHKEIFWEWLQFPLQQQRRDLAEYIESIKVEREIILRTWLTPTSFRKLIPTTAREAEGLLLISDLELIVEILQNELSA